jgi:hypothetical protein
VNGNDKAKCNPSEFDEVANAVLSARRTRLSQVPI